MTMSYYLAAIFVVLFGLSVVAVAADPSATSSATNDQARPRVTLSLADVPVTEALETLFAGTGLKYELRPGITGRVVEIRLNDIEFDQALSAIASAAKLTYEVTNGVYVIGPERDTSARAHSEKTAEAAPADSVSDTEVAENATPAALEPSQERSLLSPESLGYPVDYPVYYGQPSPGYEGPGLLAYPFTMRFGNVTVVNRYPPLVVGPVRRIFTPTAIYGPGPRTPSPPAEEQRAGE